ELALPEPRVVWTAVLFRGTRQIRPAGHRGATGPDQLPPALDVRREKLVLQVPVRDSGALDQRSDVASFGRVAGERLLAGDSLQRALATLHRRDDLLHVLDPLVIRTADPDRVDVRVGHHLRDRSVGARVTHVDLPGEPR